MGLPTHTHTHTPYPTGYFTTSNPEKINIFSIFKNFTKIVTFVARVRVRFCVQIYTEKIL